MTASPDPRAVLKRLPGRLHALGPAVALAAAALLGLLHLWFLGARLAAGDFADPAVVLRWTTAGVLVATLAALRRRGVPLLWGRQALAFWVLVLLLHWNAAGPAAAADSPQAESAAHRVVVLLPPAGALGALLLGSFVLALATRGFGRPTPEGHADAAPVRGLRAAGPPALLGPLAPRPPPTLA